MPKKLLRITTVKPLANFRVHVKLTDGTEREINLRPFLYGPMFEPILKSPSLFRKVQVEHGTLSWPTGADLDPDVLLKIDIESRVASRYIQATPSVCDPFDGMTVYIYGHDKHRFPHIHVFHGSEEALVAIADGEVVVGHLGAAQHRKIKQWIAGRREEFLAAFARAQAGANPGKIPPPL